MRRVINTSRRALLKKLTLATALIPALNATSGNVFAGDPLLQVDDPAAKARGYVDDASKSSAAPAGRTCKNCAMYEGAEESTQGPCSVFPGKHVKATGWCSAWAPQM